MPGLYDLFPEGALSGLGAGVSEPIQQSQGILGFPNANSALIGIARGLTAAGSQDPGKTAMMFAQNDREQAEEKRKATDSTKKKFTQIGKTPFFSVQAPDGTFAVVDDAGNPIPAGALQQYIVGEQQREIEAWQGKKRFEAGLGTEKETIKDIIPAAGGPTATAEPSTDYTQSMNRLGNFQRVWGTGAPMKDDNGQAVVDKNGNPVIDSRSDMNKVFFGTVNSPALAGARDKFLNNYLPDFAGNEAVYRRDFDMYLKNDVSKTIKELGSNPSTADLKFKIEQFPDAYKDRPEVIAAYLRDVKEVKEEAERRRQEAVQKRDSLIQNRTAPVSGGVKPTGASAGLPSAALSQLREGAQTEFNNGQVWTLEGGKPKRIK